MERFELLRGTGGCIINPDADDERSMPSRFGDQRLKTGDVLRVERPAAAWALPSSEVRRRCWMMCGRGYVSVERGAK